MPLRQRACAEEESASEKGKDRNWIHTPWPVQEVGDEISHAVYTSSIPLWRLELQDVDHLKVAERIPSAWRQGTASQHGFGAGKGESMCSQRLSGEVLA